ncbi:metallopeptidase family protein [Chloroflexota bacterium]
MAKKKDALSLRSFEHLVKKALESLPGEFHRYLENVVVVIEEEPPDDMPDLLGLYEGIPLVERSLDETNLPDQITLFKGPIVRACNTLDEIETEVRITVLHEIGHFFGLEEVQLQKLEVGKGPRNSGKDNWR